MLKRETFLYIIVKIRLDCGEKHEIIHGSRRKSFLADIHLVMYRIRFYVAVRASKHNFNSKLIENFSHALICLVSAEWRWKNIVHLAYIY